MAEENLTAAGSVPPPDTTALLRFLDFIYAVVFTTFVRDVYDLLIYAPPAPDSAERLPILLFSGLVFFFVATDWIHARILTQKLEYGTYTRFWLDLVIAFVAYGALNRAVRGLSEAVVYVTVMFLFGMIWAWLTLAEQAPEAAFRRKVRLILATHSAASVTFGLFCYLYIFSAETVALTSDVIWRFIVVLTSIFLLEEMIHVKWLPKDQWLGPSALPIPRQVIFDGVERIRSAWYRVMKDGQTGETSQPPPPPST